MRQSRHPFHRSFRYAAVAPAALSLALAGAAPAEAGGWTIELEPLLMDAYGHDQHVLSVRDLSLDLAGPSLLVGQSAESVDTNAGGAYRGRFRYDRGSWGWGIDYLWFSTSQDQVARSAAGSGPLDAVAFEIANRIYISSGPGEVLFFNVLEDTDLAIWTADLYARRTLATGGNGDLSLLFGLRVGDFDNDYRAVTGVEGVAGSRQDASSNYGAMYGPLLGIEAEARRGRHAFGAYLSQSVLLGEAGLASRTRDFLGPLGAEPDFLVDESFQRTQDVAIPISELRLRWTYRATRRLVVGLTANAMTWWDVPVPPGVVPGGPRLLENTIVFVGTGASVRLTLGGGGADPGGGDGARRLRARRRPAGSAG